VQYLVKKCEAKVESVFKSGATPLVIAAEKGYKDIVQFLLYEGNADAEKAGAGGWVLIVSFYLTFKNALHIATRGGYVDICRMLLDKGSPLDHQDQRGDTCLHIAIEKEFVAVASLLVKYGANFLRSNNEGKSALQVLSRHPNMKHILEGVTRVPCHIIPLTPDEDVNKKLVQTVINL
jgi:ankyrin repeat protein